ncbi:MAG: glycoside hydrolase family 20 zincin-like fold domain-containing protein, partial [Candidatus Latescibacterota bacterium]
MSADSIHRDLPCLVPQPQQVTLETGRVDLRQPLALRAAPELVEVAAQVLRQAGARVADGAAWSVEVDAAPDGSLSAHGPEAYELQVGADGARIRGASEAGCLWGVHTLAELCRQALAGRPLPALRVRDWPDLPHRGIFVESKWGPDRMGRDDWFLVVDRLARLKMNRLGIGLYGCWGSCRFEPGPAGSGWPTEFLMVPVPAHPELRSPKRLRWFSPAAGRWRDETYLPRLFAEDCLGDVVSYARRRGVTVIPFVNSLGHNTLIPRLLPEVAARDEDGRPRGIGYCLTSPQTRSFIAGFYGGIVERYFGGTADFFHIQLDEVWPDNPDPQDPLRREDPWCRCPQCRRRRPEDNLQDYIVWLVEMLVRCGVQRVVMWNDQLTRHMDALDARLVGELRERGLLDRLVLHWWWYSNEALNDRTRVALGRQVGIPGWVAPMTCYFNWQQYSPRLDNIDLMLGMAHQEGAEGAVAYAVHDPGWADHEMLLASHAWHPGAVASARDQVAHWARARLGEQAPRYLEAVALLRRAASCPALGRCYHYTYTYVREGKPFPRPYPLEALQELAKLEGAGAQLGRAAREAAAAGEALGALAAAAEVPGALAGPGAAEGASSVVLEGEDRAMLLSLQAEAARIEGLAQAFAFLLPVWQEAAAGHSDQGAPTACARARAALLQARTTVEQG